MGMGRLELQKTVSKSVEFKGIGLHTGAPVRLVVVPAPAGHGIVFERSDLEGVRMPALWHNVRVSPLNTRLCHESGAYISTIEHLMAAFAGLGIHNALCQIDGPEVPILDGSAAPFVRRLLDCGLREQNADMRVIEIRKPVRFELGDAWAELRPASRVLMDFAIDFSDAAIGRQKYRLDLANGAFLRELAGCRTFCRKADVDAMHQNGLALGGSMENAIVVDQGKVLNPTGLRHPQEAVRHKMLDALGDLYTAGAPILGHYIGNRAGHAVTNGLLCALMEDPDAWRWRHVGAGLAICMPGSDLTAADLACVA